MMTKTPSTYWVCEDCVSADAGIMDEWQADGYTPDRDPLSLIPAAAEVTAGLVWEEHECGLEGTPYAHEVSAECGCERREFSWSRCDGCGSMLGGSREALTVWE